VENEFLYDDRNQLNFDISAKINFDRDGAMRLLFIDHQSDILHLVDIGNEIDHISILELFEFSCINNMSLVIHITISELNSKVMNNIVKISYTRGMCEQTFLRFENLSLFIELLNGA
jgi:hypothetical protein